MGQPYVHDNRNEPMMHSSLAAVAKCRGPQAGIKSPRPVTWVSPCSIVPSSNQKPADLRPSGLVAALAAFVTRPQADNQIGAVATVPRFLNREPYALIDANAS